eukprot:3124258-Amphidinium_carterae.1
MEVEVCRVDKFHCRLDAKLCAPRERGQGQVLEPHRRVVSAEQCGDPVRAFAAHKHQDKPGV